MISHSHCMEWFKNPIRNPVTGKSIIPNGRVYKKLLNHCSRFDEFDIHVKKLTNKHINPTKAKEICDAFTQNKKKNPMTNANIKENGPTYRKLEKLCNENIPFNKKSLKKKSPKKIIQEDEVCHLFKENTNKNPKTGRNIKENGPTFNKLIKMCNTILTPVSPTKIDTLTTNEINLIVKQISNPKSRLVGGTALTEYLSLLYLITKHDENCSPIIKNVKLNPFIGHQHYELIVDIGQSKYKGFVPRSFFKEFKKCMKENKRFIISILGIEKGTLGHANGLIYDTKTQTLERFEPHGATRFYNSNRMDKVVQNMFKAVDIPIKHYLKPLDFCPRISFQSLEIKSTSSILQLDPVGFCSYWSTWYMDIRLSNPHLDAKQVVGESIKAINENYDGFKEFIRSYAVFINELQTHIYKHVIKMKNLTLRQQNQEIQKIISKLIKKSKIV
jgi:hypothetical protein